MFPIETTLTAIALGTGNSMYLKTTFVPGCSEKYGFSLRFQIAAQQWQIKTGLALRTTHLLKALIQVLTLALSSHIKEAVPEMYFHDILGGYQ